MLERLAAGIATGAADIAAMGVGGLLPEAERPQPRHPGDAIGAIVLAAGRSTRMGGANKLLADLDGRPVIAHTVDAVLAAGLPPVVVTGHMADAVRAALAGRAVRFVAAADYADGLSRSLAAGLAAAPAEWRAALIVLGDMPRIARGDAGGDRRGGRRPRRRGRADRRRPPRQPGRVGPRPTGPG